MPRPLLAFVCAGLLTAASGLLADAAAQVATPGGGLRLSAVTSEPEVASSTDTYFANDGFFSVFFRNFRGWGTSAVARPAYRTPALVLRERVGMTKTR